MRIRTINKIAILLLTVLSIHFSCYFPVASAAPIHDMQVHNETIDCCGHSNGICHDVSDMSFLNSVTFKIADTTFLRFFEEGITSSEKPILVFKSYSLKNPKLENIRTVQIII
jgi:hypothetical protein